MDAVDDNLTFDIISNATNISICNNFDEQSNAYYLNISCETLLEYSVPLYGFCMPFILLITVIANTLIVIVLSKRNMASPTNAVLLAMALCDMFTILVPAPGLMYMLTFGNHYKPLSSILTCFMWNVFNELIPAMLHTASVWLTVALATQRYIFVCYAPTARVWCTMPRIKRCIMYICMGAFLHQISRFFDRSYMLISINWNNKTTSVCQINTAQWISEYIGEDLYFSSYYFFRILFIHLVPCILLVTLNLLLFRAMRQAQNRRKKLLSENKKKESKNIRDANCTTLMLIVVVTVFLSVETPLAVITALHIISSTIIEFLDYNIANLFIMFANFSLIISYPINFAIYCGMSRQFRETFKGLFQKKSSTNNASRFSKTCTNDTVVN